MYARFIQKQMTYKKQYVKDRWSIGGLRDERKGIISGGTIRKKGKTIGIWEDHPN